MKLSRSLAALLVLGTSSAIAQSASAVSGAGGSAEVLASLTSWLGTYLAVLAGTSGLALALLEAYKKMFTIRGKFHRTAVIRWLSQDTQKIPVSLQLAKPGIFSSVALGGGNHYAARDDRSAKQAQAPAAQGQDVASTAYRPEAAYAEFFHLTSGQKEPEKPQPKKAVLRWRGIDRAVFELETSRMMSQVQDAADAVLNNPWLYPQLYAFLTRGASRDDADAWRHFIANPQAGTTSAKEASDRYGRIRLLMRRQLDAFQCVTTSRWNELNQMWAVVVGALLLFVTLVITADPGYAQRPDFEPWQSLCAGIGHLTERFELFAGVVLKAAFGGALAPIAKDLLMNLSSLKFTK